MALSPKSKLAWLAGGLVLLLVVLVLGLWLAGYTPRELWGLATTASKTVMGFLRSLGPLAFFIAMALLPSLGFPLLGFTVIAAPLFSAQLGIWTVAGLVLLSFSINLCLTYWLARYAMRPLCTRLLTRLGYSVPVLDREDHMGITLVLRLTPGPPFFAQNYLLGMMEVNFVIYYLISLAITGSLSLSLVFFGDSLMHGSSAQIFLGVSLVIVVTVIIRMVQRHLAARKAKA